MPLFQKLSKSKLVKFNFERKYDLKVLHEKVRKFWEREQQHIETYAEVNPELIIRLAS